MKNEQATARDVARGSPISYRVKFPLSNPLPTLKEVVLNNQLLCTGLDGPKILLTTRSVNDLIFNPQPRAVM